MMASSTPSYSTSINQGEDKDQLLVQTPYGLGLVIQTRCNKTPKSSNAIKAIRLLDWEHGTTMTTTTMTTRNKSRTAKKVVPMLYTTIEYESVTIKKGDEVLTPYGRGVVEDTVVVRIRQKKKTDPSQKDHSQDEEGDTKDETTTEAESKEEKVDERILFKYRVLISSWRLAGRSRVKCYLFSPQVKVVRCKTLGEMNALERIDFSFKQKQNAGKLFAQKNYNRALQLYAEAVEAVRYIQHTPNNSNECRADLMAVIVTCSNNAATCCVQLKRYEEASRFAKNALILLNALYEKRGKKIHSILVNENKFSDAKMFGEWRGKSCIIIARAEADKEFYDEALEHLRKAKEFVAVYVGKDETGSNPDQKRLKEILKEFLKLKNSIVERRKIIREKEKKRAQAMFAGNNGKTKKSLLSQANGNQDNNDSSSSNISNSNISSSNTNSSISSKGTTTQDVPKTNGTASASDSNIVPPPENDESKTQVKPKLVKRVSFAAKLEEERILESDSEDEDEPWYDEHKEALILLALGGLAFATTMFGFRKR